MSSTSGADRDVEAEKEALRDRMRARRADLHGEEHVLRSARVLEHVVGTPAWAEADVVGFYVSVGGEVGTRDALRAALGEKRVAAPRTDPADGSMAFAAVEDPGVMAEGPLGVPEPDGPTVPTRDLDLVLVPGLAFDEAGNRLGRGGGYYDRFLAGCPAWSVGLAFRFQVVEAVPVTEGDVPVDAVATEDGLHGHVPGREG